MRTLFGALLLSFVVAAEATAQSTAGAVYARAQALVSEGRGAQGRALVDSVHALTAPGSAERAEALFWRASLSATAAEAERDYRAIVVDHATSPRAEDALLRLAQLELARGDRDAALRNLQRLAAEHPNSRNGARTSYWIARVLFDRNDLPAACAANADALSRVAATDIELKNQIEYQQQRCRGVAVAASSTVPATVPQRDPPPARDVRPSIPLEAPVQATPSASAAPGARSYSVQVAATSTRGGAQTIVNRMAGRGYQARIDGTAAPFRVRVGRYDTRAAANRVLSEMKAKGIDGFVAIIDAP